MKTQQLGKMKCPYCLTEFNPSQVDNMKPHTCEECGRQIPGILIRWVRDGHPWFTMGMVGYSNHGKTVYVTSLFYLLREIFMNASNWPGFNLFALDKDTIAMVFRRIDELVRGMLPEASPVNFPEPCLVQFNGLPMKEKLFATFYDIGGEVYQDTETITDRARLIAHADTLIFVISIKETERWQNEIYELLNKYLLGLHDHLGLEPRKYQNLVVAFTKADEILHLLSPDLQDHLIQGDYTKYIKINQETLHDLRQASRRIEEWLRSNNAGGFLNLAQSDFKTVQYTLISAIGQKPDGDRLHGSIQPDDPKNVLDPFLLALGNHIPFPKKEEERDAKSGSFWKRLFGMA